MRSATSASRAFAVWWRDLNRWAIPVSLILRQRVPKGWERVRIGKLVQQVTKRIKTEPETEYKMAGVRWYGEGVFHRETVRGNKMSASQVTPLVNGALIYNRLFAWKASFAVVPCDLTDCYVSNEFPQFIADTGRILPEYLYLFCTRETTIRAVNASSTGSSAVSRNRLKEEEFFNFEILLPPLAEQEAIVEHWRKAQNVLEKARDRQSEPVRMLNKRLTEIYQNLCRNDVIHSRTFVIEFKDLAAWDIKSGRAASFCLACPTFRPMSDFIEGATELVRPASEPEKDWPVYGINNKEGVFLNSFQKGAEFNVPYKRVCKDWFFHNPTRCNVGSLGIVPDVSEDAITSPEYQVWRLRKDVAGNMLPGYVACLIQTPFFLDLVQFNRVGAVKQRMYIENLMRVRIPYLPVSEQQLYADARDKALFELEAAQRLSHQINADIEALILGTKKISEL
jgi:hypothetical protein